MRMEVLLVFVAAFVLQSLFGHLQMKHFNGEFLTLRRQGKVACGRKSGGFHAGAVVMFLIDEEGIIKIGKKMMGVTVFARVTDLPGFEGKHVGRLTEEDLPKHGKNLRKAIMDASLTYQKYVAGEDIPMPPSPLKKAGNTIEALFNKQQNI